MKYVILILFTLLYTNCSVYLTVYSDPEYATIYSGGVNCGRTPITLTYSISEEEKQNGYIDIEELSARWISGAEITTNQRLELSKKGRKYQVTLKRPRDYPNVELDVNYVQERTTKEVQIK